MKRFIPMSPALLTGFALIGAVAHAEPQFAPPGGLSSGTRVGTQGATLATMQDGIERNSRDIQTLGKTGATRDDLTAAMAGYLPVKGGTLTGSLTASGDPQKGFVVTDPIHADVSSRIAYHANTGELSIENNTGINNALALKTTNENGFAALAFVGPDMSYNDNFEHGAVGWGPKLKYGPDVGYDYFEISRFTYDGTFSRQPVPFMWQSTGTQLIPWGMTTAYGVVTKGSATITCVGGCTFPGDTGQILDTPAEYGLFPAGTTIVSGAGTKTMTLSKAALASSASATAGTYFRFSTAEGSQHDFVVMTPMGNIDYFRFSDAKWGTFTNAPYFSIDRVNGRLGVGNPLPATPLDVSGAILSNISGATSLNAYSGNGALNAQVTPGVAGQKNILHGYAVNTNQFNLNWEKDPQRIAVQDANANANIFEFRMDGSWQSQQYAHPVDTVTANTALSNTAQCGRTIVVNASSAVTITVSNWTIIGCRITVTQTGTGAVTLAPGAGLTLGSYGTQAQTGPYTLPGQYASVVIEAKTANLVTVERGQ